GLDRIEGGAVPPRIGVNVERVGIVAKKDAVRGREADEIEMILDAFAHQFEKMLEEVGGQIPRRAHVELEAVRLKYIRSAAEGVVLFEDGDVVALFCEEAGCAQS